MDSEVVLNVVAIAISAISLAVSGFLAVRQNRTASAGYSLPVVVEIFGQFRSEEFFEARQYVFHELNKDFTTPVAYTDLPPAVRTKVRIVSGRYDDLGKLVAHGVVNEELIIGSNGTAIRRVWEAVAPFAYEERRKSGALTWAYLEDLAHRAARNPPQEIYARLGLRYTRVPRSRGVPGWDVPVRTPVAAAPERPAERDPSRERPRTDPAA